MRRPPRPRRAPATLTPLFALAALAACGDPSPPAPVDMSPPEDARVTSTPDLAPADAGGAEGGAAAGGAAGGAAPDPDDALCAPCEAGAGACAAGFVCHAPSAPAGEEAPPPFCTRPCDPADAPCPAGYSCEEPSGGAATSADAGAPARLCAPARGFCAPVFCNDGDGDGYGRGRDCLGLDCDDANPAVHPGVALDLCDGVDNNCDGLTDEHFEPTPCGEGACAGVSVCDGGRARCDAGQPSGEDANCDGRDDDCDGRADEGYQPLSCGLGVCRQESFCATGEERCAPLPPSPGETDAACDGLDADCDGLVDEGFVGEVCGLGVCAARGVCTPQGLSCAPGPLLGNDADCNLLDDDCDGRVDEGFVPATRCGLGACYRAETCGPRGPACVPAPPLSATDATCDGVDDNCDGVVDDACAENALGFTLVSQDASSLVVAIRLSRGQEQGPPNVATLPSTFDLHVRLPAGLSVGALPLGQTP
ncbi:MAG: hypothetical protein FJ138_19265, partial [Deltaproteobacteria bacterium]|nr:hypothetical protein [Deltaproteobacteria bacterium]